MKRYVVILRVPTSFGQEFSKKDYQITKDVKFVKLSLHSISIMQMLLQFDDFFGKKKNPNYNRRKICESLVIYILAKQCRSPFNLTKFLTKLNPNSNFARI